MKSRKLLTMIMAIVLVLTFLTTTAMAVDPLALPSTPTATLSVTVDGDPLTVYNYRVVYVANPVPVVSGGNITFDYETMNIYVPENATEDSPIILQDNNGGWNGGVAGTSVTDGTAYSIYSTNTSNQKTAVQLEAGYVIANVGCRSRLPGRNQDVDGNYIAHSPAQVVDVKAAIRYLRHNDAAMAGTCDRIIITGTSGGGALGVAIAASGNSPDYYPYLYELGAAGVSYNAHRRTYSSTLRDDVFGTVLYCAITDLDHMDAAYEWMYNATRKELGTYILNNQVTSYSKAQLYASDWYAVEYVSYFNGLGLRDENGKRLNAPHFRDAIKAAAERGVEKAYREVGPDQMDADISSSTYPDSTWYTIDTHGKATVDLDKYLQFVAKNTNLKGVPASDNYASPLPNPEPTHNESSLAGTTSQVYSNFDDWAWNHNAIPGDGVGLDDTGLVWRHFIRTDAGKAVVKQMVMSNPIPYLVSGEGDPAPYWYFRHGMKDRDTSFDVPVAVYYAVLNAYDVSNVNFNLAWLKPHSGDYDVPEAYEWVAEAVDNAKYFDAVDALIGDEVTHGFTLPTGDETNVITYSSSNEKVFKVVDGQVLVTRPAKKDAKVTLTVEVVSDKISFTGFNYGEVDVTRAFTFTVPAKEERTKKPRPFGNFGKNKVDYRTR
jgi:BD-FAE